MKQSKCTDSEKLRGLRGISNLLLLGLKQYEELIRLFPLPKPKKHRASLPRGGSSESLTRTSAATLEWLRKNELEKKAKAAKAKSKGSAGPGTEEGGSSLGMYGNPTQRKAQAAEEMLRR